MPANNSKTNRSIRRTAALKRFTTSPKRSVGELARREKFGLNEGYTERKAVELAALESHNAAY